MTTFLTTVGVIALVMLFAAIPAFAWLTDRVGTYDLGAERARAEGSEDAVDEAFRTAIRDEPVTEPPVYGPRARWGTVQSRRLSTVAPMIPLQRDGGES